MSSTKIIFLWMFIGVLHNLTAFSFSYERNLLYIYIFMYKIFIL